MSERRVMLASGDMVAAQPEQRAGDGLIVYRAVYLPRQQAIDRTKAIAIQCNHAHLTIDAAISCAKAFAAVMPIHIDPLEWERAES